MDKIGIIAEYNPFHNGHEYQIRRAKELVGSEYVVICMSGNFVQRGGPAIVDKNIRARMAIDNGASIVIELPMPFSCQSAEDFAYASIMELKKMKVSHLSFGAETENVNLLYDIANMQLDENSIYNMHVKKYLDDGLSYANACMNAVMDCYKNSDFADEINQVFKANNILGIEYIKACIKLDYTPEIIIVKRTGNDHNEITHRQGKYSSAMSIRRNMLAGDLNIENKIPEAAFALLRGEFENNYMHIGLYFDYIKFLILHKTAEELNQIYGMEEGIENRIRQTILHAENMDDFFDRVISKRYNRAKVSRLINNILLNIRKKDIEQIKNDTSSYVKILAMNSHGREILSDLRDKLIYISKFSDFKRNGIDAENDLRFNLTARTTNIYNHLYLKDYKDNLEYKIPCQYIK